MCCAPEFKSWEGAEGPWGWEAKSWTNLEGMCWEEACCPKVAQVQSPCGIGPLSGGEGKGSSSLLSFLGRASLCRWTWQQTLGRARFPASNLQTQVLGQCDVRATQDVAVSAGWIVDSGSFFGLAGSSLVHDTGCTVKEVAPHKLIISNGRTEIPEEASVRMIGLGFRNDVLVTKEVSSLLSLSRLCMNFRPGAGRAPSVVLPSGTLRELAVDHMCRCWPLLWLIPPTTRAA